MFKYLMICLETHCLNASKLLPTPSWEKKKKNSGISTAQKRCQFSQVCTGIEASGT